MDAEEDVYQAQPSIASRATACCAASHHPDINVERALGWHGLAVYRMCGYADLAVRRIAPWLMARGHARCYAFEHRSVTVSEAF